MHFLITISRCLFILCNTVNNIHKWRLSHGDDPDSKLHKSHTGSSRYSYKRTRLFLTRALATQCFNCCCAHDTSRKKCRNMNEIWYVDWTDSVCASTYTQCVCGWGWGAKQMSATVLDCSPSSSTSHLISSLFSTASLVFFHMSDDNSGPTLCRKIYQSTHCP